METTVIKVGLKNNALILFKATNGNNLGGSTGGIYHNAIINLNPEQFESFKQIIKLLGFSIEKSLIELSEDMKKRQFCDYSVYLEK